LTRYFIFISFKGTYYHGWQIQPDDVTIQRILNNALTLILGEKISTSGAGRTDSGVHALLFCAHFDSRNSDLADRKSIVLKLNSFLPRDIVVKNIKRVKKDSDARFSAISRTYKYYVSRVKNPFNDSYCWYFHGDLDIDRMNMAASLLLNFSDFTSFSRLHSGSKTNLCNIYSAGWVKEADLLVFTITADRFLRNMVRALVGTLVDVGRNRISIAEFETIILAKNRSKAGVSAPAKGLFLTGIDYPGEIFI
jgi:tRNA pseudouridine38-40 synthase